MSKTHKQKKSPKFHTESKQVRLNKKVYFSELEGLQLELVKLHEWVKAQDKRKNMSWQIADG